MIIYLNPEVASGLGEDTFWTWFKREIPNSEFLTVNSKVKYNDVILQYSTMGKSLYPNNTVCLLWELYPEMKQKLKSNMWDDRIQKIEESIKTSKKVVVSTKFTIEFYKKIKNIDILPIGVDTNLFKPLDNKNELKKKYNIPLNKKIGVWVGTTHKMKGFDKFLKYKKNHPDIFWIIIWKWNQEAAPINDKKCVNFIKAPQEQMNELFNCGDFFLSTSRLRPFYMSEWEAMASNLPFIIVDNVKKDFLPSSKPREQIFKYGWDRKNAKNKWVEYTTKFSEEKTIIDLIRFELPNFLNNLKNRFNKKVVKNKINNLLCKINPSYRRICRIENLINQNNEIMSIKIDKLFLNQSELEKKVNKFLKNK